MMLRPSLTILFYLLPLFTLLANLSFGVAATCEQCAVTGDCTAALPQDQPGTFCTTTTTDSLTTHLCCPPTLTCLPSSPSLPNNLTCRHPLSAVAHSSSDSNNASSVGTDKYVSFAFIGVSLLFAGFLAFLICCVCCHILVAAAGQWRRKRRRAKGMKGVAPVESEVEQRDREEREQKERDDMQRQDEQREEARMKAERLLREREEMEAIVQRAREQVERWRRERQQAAVEALAGLDEDQRTLDSTETGAADTEEGAVCWTDEIELTHV